MKSLNLIPLCLLMLGGMLTAMTPRPPILPTPEAEVTGPCENVGDPCAVIGTSGMVHRGTCARLPQPSEPGVRGIVTAAPLICQTGLL